MDRIKSKVIINRLLQTLSEDAQQAVSGGASDYLLVLDGIKGESSSTETSTVAPYQGKRSSGGYVPT